MQNSREPIIGRTAAVSVLAIAFAAALSARMPAGSAQNSPPTRLTPAPLSPLGVPADTVPPSGEVSPPDVAARTTISAPPAETDSTGLAPSSGKGASKAPLRVKPAAIRSADNGGQADSSPFAGFEGKSNRGPVNIKSDSLSFDYRNHLVDFNGHVHAVQSGSELTSDTLHVEMDDKSQIQHMTADGNVRMSQGQRWATGDHALLDQSAHTIVLTGSPVVHDGQDQIAGRKITVYLQTGKSVVEDPKAVIFPRDSKSKDNDDSAADSSQ